MLRFLRYVPDLLSITQKTAAAWVKADPFRQSAVVAYYAIFSIPALLVIVIACAGLVFGHEAVKGEIASQVEAALGTKAAEQIEDIVAKAGEHKSSVFATIIGVITLIVGSTGVFAQLQTSLNRIWGVKVTAKKKWLKSAKDRLFSFGLVLSIGFLMLVSLLITAGLEAFGHWIRSNLPDFMLFLFHALNFLVSFSAISVLFALMFKILPDAVIRWSDVWIGAMFTTLLFLAGKFGLGIYFAKASPGSAYGAAGSVVLIMLWVSYSCMIVFFGAEFTRQFAVHFGREIRPAREAELIEEEDEKERLK